MDEWRSGPIFSPAFDIKLFLLCLFLCQPVPEMAAQDSAVPAPLAGRTGRSPRVAAVSLEGNSLLGEVFLRGVIASGPGRDFSEQVVAGDLQRLAEAYADQGLPHARVSAADFTLNDSGLQYVYRIEEGPLVTVEDVQYRGIRQTREQTIRRLAGLRSEFRFSRLPVERARKRLIRSGLFRDVSGPVLISGSGPGREVLMFRVEESSYNSIFGAVGYSRDESLPDGWLTGRIEMSFSNLAGSGQQARISWQRLKKENSRLSAEYSAPWIFRWNAGFRGGVSHQIEDSSYTQSSGRAILEFPAGDNFSAGVGGEAVRVVPGSSGTISRSLRYSSLWNFSFDNRGGDGRGTFSFLEIEYGRKRYYEPAIQLTVSRIRSDVSRWQGLGQRHSLYLAGHARAVMSSERPVPRTEQFAMGGAASLRGYWEDQFYADQLAWTNLEYRYQPDRRLVIYPFFDLGYFYDPHRSLRGYRPGYGAGLMLNTALGWFSLGYGLGEGDRIGHGKVHFNLNSDF
jgi:outer membrane protein assembly factor BamA